MELYGIWAVLIASCFEGELVIVLSGIAANAELLPWPWVILVGWTGTYCATQGGFYLVVTQVRPYWHADLSFCQG